MKKYKYVLKRVVTSLESKTPLEKQRVIEHNINWIEQSTGMNK